MWTAGHGAGSGALRRRLQLHDRVERLIPLFGITRSKPTKRRLELGPEDEPEVPPICGAQQIAARRRLHRDSKHPGVEVAFAAERLAVALDLPGLKAGPRVDLDLDCERESARTGEHPVDLRLADLVEDRSESEMRVPVLSAELDPRAGEMRQELTGMLPRRTGLCCSRVQQGSRDAAGEPGVPDSSLNNSRGESGLFLADDAY